MTLLFTALQLLRDTAGVFQVLTTVTFDSPDSAAKVDTISAIVR